MTVVEDVRAAVDDEWRTAREIHQRIGRWSPFTVSDRLTSLFEEGAIERKLDGFKGGGARAFYRRLQINGGT